MGVNRRSLAFHARHGFELVGRQRAIGRLNGILHDVVILQRLLPDAPPLQD
jgi:phosphinothricin acetyltransferase